MTDIGIMAQMITPCPR